MFVPCCNYVATLFRQMKIPISSQTWGWNLPPPTNKQGMKMEYYGLSVTVKGNVFNDIHKRRAESHDSTRLENSLTHILELNDMP